MPLRFRLLAALAGAVLFSACARAQSEPIKIGEFASMTGKEAVFGQFSHKGALLAVEEINAKGGVLGRPIELLLEDDQSKPGEAATIVKKFVSRDKVHAILGEISSSRTLEAAPIAQTAKIPLLSPGATNPDVTTKGDYVFRACFIDPFVGTIMAKFATSSLKVKRIAILSSVTSAQAVGLSKFFRERFTAAGGTVVVEQKYSDGDKDFRAQLTAIRAANVDGIFVPGYYTEAALISKQARELGLTAALIGTDGWESADLISIGGKAVEGAYIGTHYSPESSDKVVVEFNERFRKRWSQESNALAALGYDSVLMLADAFKRAGSAEPAKVRDALAATKNFRGTTGVITLDAQRNATKSAVVLQVRDGKFVFVERVDP